MSCDLVKPKDQRSQLTLWWELLKASEHPGKFGRHRLNDNEDIMFFHFHVILQDHVTRIKELYVWKTLKVNHHPVKFGDHRHCDSGDKIAFVCHVISIDERVK